MWWKSAVNRSFFLCLAACRMRSSACDTLSRLCARRVLCWSAFPLVSALRSTGSARRIAPPLCSPASQLLWRSPTSRVRASSATAPRLPDADRRLDTHARRRPDARSPRFRRDPFARDVALRPRQGDSASHSGIAHVAFDHEDGLRPCDLIISWLNPTPHALAVYASWSASPPAHATLASRRLATALPGPDFHRLIAPACLAPSLR